MLVELHVFVSVNILGRGSLPLRPHFVASYPLCGLKRHPQRWAESFINVQFLPIIYPQGLFLVFHDYHYYIYLHQPIIIFMKTLEKRALIKKKCPEFVRIPGNHRNLYNLATMQDKTPLSL